MAGRTPKPTKYALIPPNQIQQNLFDLQSTFETLKADLAEIGTIKQWTAKYGRMFSHDTRMMESVSRLLTEGVKKLDTNTGISEPGCVSTSASQVPNVQFWWYCNHSILSIP